MLKAIHNEALKYRMAYSGNEMSAGALKDIQNSFNISLQYLKANMVWSVYQPFLAEQVRDIVILLSEELTPIQRKNAIDFLKVHRLQGQDSNSIFSNELGMHYGALANDSAYIVKCRDRVLSSFEYSKVTLIQPDLSMLNQDGEVAIYGSGKEMLLSHLRLAYTLSGTSLAYPEDHLDLILKLLTTSWQWMARGIHTVPFMIERRYAGQDALLRPEINKYFPLMMKLYPSKTDMVHQLTMWQQNRVDNVSIHYWPDAQVSVYHSPEVSYFISTGPTRAGETYFLSHGKEYLNLPLVSNLRSGATTFKGARPGNLSPVSGSVTIASSGLTAMELTLRDSSDRKHITVKKCWAIHNGVLVYLIGGASGNYFGDVSTAINEARSTGNVFMSQTRNALKKASKKVENPEWVHHDGLAYLTFPFYKDTLKVALKKSTEYPNAADGPGDYTRESENIFSLSLVNKGASPPDVASGIAIFPAKTPEIAKGLASAPKWGVMRNSPNCQGVYFEDGTYMLAFYAAQSFNHNNKISFEVSGPCLLLVDKDKVYVSNITKSEKKLRIKINNIVYFVTPPVNGKTIEAETTE